MYIGCNWSKALKFLLEKDAVKIDYIKSGAFWSVDEEVLIIRLMLTIFLSGLGYF